MATFSRESQCGSKRTLSKAEAKRNLRYMQSSGQSLDNPHTLTVYRCSYCGWWHIGNDWRKA